MLFNSYIFLVIFLPITYLVFWLLRTAQQRYIWLAITGYVFYGYWDPRFCLLMAFSTLVSFLAGLGLNQAQTPTWRKIYLVVPIAIDLLLLSFFKYTNFALQTYHDTATLFGWHVTVPNWNIVLPVGISFYTFHTITYIVDCYRGVIRPTTNPFEFMAYVSLFSQLVAGPIVRFRQIEDDLERLGTADRFQGLGIGASFFVFGLVEKVLMADSLAGFVDTRFAAIEVLSTLEAWATAWAYTFQLYFDFCGYSTMAVGLGLMFGIRIPQNFDSPYRAHDPSDFWKRWHISLSTCLRDYLYIPLGGNRHGTFNTKRNLMITMLLGGLWHGASWSFVLWGAYHGLLLVVHQGCAKTWAQLPLALRRAIMLLLVAIGWVMFRAPTMENALDLYHAMFTWKSRPLLGDLTLILPAIAFAFAWSVWGKNAFEWHRDRRWSRPIIALECILFGICLAMIAADRNSPFLYFQF